MPIIRIGLEVSDYINNMIDTKKSYTDDGNLIFIRSVIEAGMVKKIICGVHISIFEIFYAKH